MATGAGRRDDPGTLDAALEQRAPDGDPDRGARRRRLRAGARGPGLLRGGDRAARRLRRTAARGRGGPIPRAGAASALAIAA
ncbi:MAG: hypothetical protein EPN98_11905 [Phenylobacterium sp.]|nr:MAG: hypothetical protein EPN98_11905 [Phenylobacterium sp.]